VKAVHDAVFGGDHTPMIDSMRQRLHTGAVGPVLALAGDEPVCAARVDFHVGTDFASLWGGGTLPEWRGKGIYRAMVSHRARLARARGHRYLRTDALPTSRPILEKMGFARLTMTVPYTRL
jgi:GNAT superfamily N-acetyltransferase